MPATAVVLIIASGKPRPAGAIVVLGCPAEPDGSISPHLRARMDAALALYRQGLAPLLLVSGGAVRTALPEAAVMRQYALRQGVPDDALLLEDRSRNTLENMKFSHALLQERDVRQVLVVTTRFHTRRAAILARRFLRLPAQIIAADDAPGVSLGEQMRLVVNETFLVIYTLLRMGWARLSGRGE